VLLRAFRGCDTGRYLRLVLKPQKMKATFILVLCSKCEGRFSEINFSHLYRNLVKRSVRFLVSKRISFSRCYDIATSA
jgi:hypothetical protein